MITIRKYAFRLLILNLLLISAFPQCGKDKEETSADATENAVDPLPYIGIYRIEPTTGNVLFLDKNGRAVVNDRDGAVIQTGRYSTGRASLRIFFSDNPKPDAVFLLDDYAYDGWRGRWGEDIKILYRN